MPIDIVMPRLGWTMEEGILVEWLVKDGQTIEPGKIVFTVETDKALNEVESIDGGIVYIPAGSPPPGTNMPVGTVIGYLLEPDEPAPEYTAPDLEAIGSTTPGQTATAPPSPTRPPPSPKPAGAVTISPRAQRKAAELGVDWTQLQGSGRSGRIVERDVIAAVDGAPAALTAGNQREALSPVRKITADRMSNSARTAAPVTLNTEVDATEIVRLRTQLKQDSSNKVVPTYNDFLVKATAEALTEHPDLNARLHNSAAGVPAEIERFSSVHIGVAVDGDRGLLVPVLRDVQAKTVNEIATESAELLGAAVSGRVNLDALKGGTFTITNLGMYDIDNFSPIIDLPQCAILGVGRIVPKLVVIDAAAEQTGIRHMMGLSLTFDHRLVDGAPPARFLQRLKQLIEQPHVWLDP